MQNMKIKVGKYTPVWRNKHTGEIACGPTWYDATGVSPYGVVTKLDWEKVTKLEPSKRVCIDETGRVLPVNKWNTEIASHATKPGDVTIQIGTRTITQRVVYVDDTRVIYGGK